MCLHSGELFLVSGRLFSRALFFRLLIWDLFWFILVLCICSWELFWWTGNCYFEPFHFSKSYVHILESSSNDNYCMLRPFPCYDLPNLVYILQRALHCDFYSETLPLCDSPSLESSSNYNYYMLRPFHCYDLPNLVYIYSGELYIVTVTLRFFTSVIHLVWRVLSNDNYCMLRPFYCYDLPNVVYSYILWRALHCDCYSETLHFCDSPSLKSSY